MTAGVEPASLAAVCPIFARSRAPSPTEAFIEFDEVELAALTALQQVSPMVALMGVHLN
jgi:hypothetical protein